MGTGLINEITGNFTGSINPEKTIYLKIVKYLSTRYGLDFGDTHEGIAFLREFLEKEKIPGSIVYNLFNGCQRDHVFTYLYEVKPDGSVRISL
jgi:hypothetical protein